MHFQIKINDNLAKGNKIVLISIKSEKMDTNVQSTGSVLPGRINSVDFYRGLTMFLLAGESTLLYDHFQHFHSGILHFLGTQLSHHAWHGLHFWDLIQPFFMFIVGVSIPFAVANRLKKGDSKKTITRHALKRSFLLLLFGWGLYCIYANGIVWQFQNVLAQLSVTYLVAFLIRDKSFTFQIIFTLVILVVIDLAYRFFPLAGFNHPWINHENLGAWVNIKIEGVDRSEDWATLNVISTTAHTVWGVLCGKLLMSEKSASKKIQTLLIAGVIALVIGYSLDLLNITPIIKKIATSSFVFTSGGYAILVLCLLYWLIDVKKLFATGPNMFKIVGMNSIFIYMFFMLGGAEIFTRSFNPFTTGLFYWMAPIWVSIITSLIVWAALWYVCYWLYKNKLFIKI
jgi:predicted acyltransferase